MTLQRPGSVQAGIRARLTAERHSVPAPGTFCPSRLFSAILIVACTCSTAVAQAPESYAVPHLFSLPTATTTRQFGMGGMTSCVLDIGFPNPAFAGALESSRAAVRVSRTEFDGGLKLTGWQGWYATPLRPGEGVQVLGLLLDSERGNVAAPEGPPLPGTLDETDLAFHYGRRLSEQWLVGAGIAPVFHTTFNLYNPADGSVVVHADSEAEFGCRVGALYQYAPEGFVGFVFDRYDEDVTFSAPTLPAPASFSFTSTEWALGVSGRLDERVLGAAEWLELRSEDDGRVSETEGLHIGIEVAATDALSLRAGSNDGALSLGAGYEHEGWVVNYAYLDDWNDDSVGAAFGSSDTHQFEVGRTW